MKARKIIAIALLCAAIPAGQLGLTAYAAEPSHEGGSQVPAMAQSRATSSASLYAGLQGIQNGDSIYYGAYTYGDGQKRPLQWQVLDATQTNTKTSDGIFVLSKYILAEKTFSNKDSSNWVGSLVRQWCADFAGDTSIYQYDTVPNAFDSAEFAGILQTTKTDNAGTFYGSTFVTNKLENDRVFILSAEEASTYISNIGNSTLSAQKIFKDDGETNSNYIRSYPWFLRSGHQPYSPSNPKTVGIVDDAGGVRSNSVTNNAQGIRPAMNIDASAVLFTSAANEDKFTGTVDADALASVAAPGSSVKEWKLTLLDSTRNLQIDSATLESTQATINYSNANTGPDEYLSAVIKNSSGNVTYYGRIKALTDAGDASGTVTINLTGKMQSGDTLHIFNEKDGGTKESDYASALLKVENQASASYSISASPSSLTFTSQEEGYTQAPAAQPVTITNNGNREVEITLPTANNYTITEGQGWSNSKATLQPNGTATFTVQPKTGLTQGNHDVTLTVSGTNNTSAAINVKFSVTANTSNQPTVTNVTVMPASVQVNKGTTQQFTATVTGTNNPSQEVKWTVEGSQSSGTSISDVGRLTVGADETASSLTVKATSVQDSSKFGTAIVTIEQTSQPTVTGVAVTPASTQVDEGGSRKFTAIVVGTNSPSQEVRWTVEGSQSSGTSISDVGRLTVGADESASSLTVKATSVQDSNEFGTATVTIGQASVPKPPSRGSSAISLPHNSSTEDTGDDEEYSGPASQEANIYH